MAAQPAFIAAAKVEWHVVASDAVSTRTASHNEPIANGAFSTIAVQAARPLIRWRGATFSWVVEALPVMRVRSGAPANRVPTPQTDPAEANNPERLARYQLRNGFGVGIAPLGAEARMPLTPRTHFLFNVTAGAAWFDQVVPYGKATQANFTVAPGVAFEQRITTHHALAAGYALHHLSNASMGGANPGMNSHLFFLRWTRLP